MKDVIHEGVKDIVLGEGKWIVGHSIVNGLPGIIFTPVPDNVDPNLPTHAGVSAEGLIPVDRILTGAVTLRFANMDSILQHLDRMKALGELIQEAYKRLDEKEKNDVGVSAGDSSPSEGAAG